VVGGWIEGIVTRRLRNEHAPRAFSSATILLFHFRLFNAVAYRVYAFAVFSVYRTVYRCPPERDLRHLLGAHTFPNDFVEIASDICQFEIYRRFPRGISSVCSRNQLDLGLLNAIFFFFQSTKPSINPR